MIGPTEFILARIQDYAAAIKYGPCSVNFRASAKPDILIELWFVPLKKERKPIHFELTPDQAIEVREGALKDAFRFAGRSFRTGKSGFGVGKVDLPRQGAISSESFNIASDTWIGRTVDYLGTAVRISASILFLATAAPPPAMPSGWGCRW